MSTRESASVRILLISNDLPTIEVLCEGIQRMSMHVEPCCDIATAGRKLCKSKFEGVIVDFNEKEQALDLLRTMRCSTSHKAAVAFAVLNHEHERVDAFAAGANFILERPLLVKTVLKTLRAALPIMVRERRRYFRCPLETDVQIIRASGQELAAKSINISEGGMTFLASGCLLTNERIQLTFRLPDSLDRIAVAAEVRWMSDLGQIGVQLLDIPPEVKQHLQVWLSKKLERMTPSLLGFASMMRYDG
jgi:DNA-binding response OmpR family regulator